MDRKLSVIFSSHLSEQDNADFIKHVESTAGKIDLHVHCVVNKNQFSLTEAYNQGWKVIDDLGRGNGAIVFCHNDILFRTKDWGKILLGMFQGSKCDIIGVAGTTELNPHGCWWLTAEGKEMNRGKMFGRVWHPQGVDRIEESIYSEKIVGLKPVVIVDGLFIAVNGSSKNDDGVPILRFDEEFKGFHLYDISFCFRNYLEGFDLGVIDRISILHKSIGMTNQEWENNRIQFANKYAEELPATI